MLGLQMLFIFGIPVNMEQKTCTKCREPKPADLNHFPPRKPPRSKDGLDGWCRLCHCSQAMKWYNHDPERINAKRRPYWNKRYANKRNPKPPKPLTEIKSLSPTELAYSAGIVDGEGCFQILFSGRSKSLNPSLCVIMTHKETIEWLAAKWGVNISPTRRKTVLDNHKPTWVVRIGGRRALLLSEKMRPYLVTKKSHSDIFLEYAALGWHIGGQTVLNKHEHAALTNKRMALKIRLHELNRRGITPRILAAWEKTSQQNETDEA